MRAWVDGVLMAGGDGGVAAPSVGARPSVGAGDSVFTTALVARGRVQWWPRHLARLASSASVLGLPEVDEDLVRRAVRETWSDAGVVDRARLRVLWGEAHDGTSHLTVRLSALAPNEEGVRVVTPSVQRTAGAVLGTHKTTVYAENMLAAAEARRAGAGEALLATTEGWLSEGTGSNVFYVVDGELRTPSLATGCLPGVARGVVLERCGAREIVEEVAVAHGSQEVFLTSSTREVQPVSEWSGRRYAAPGPVAARVQEAWRLACADPKESWNLF